MNLSFEIPDLYPWVLLCAVILSIECLLVGYIAAIPARTRVFTGMKEGFMSRFKYEHEAAFGTGARLAPGGFPDSGNGYYADRLPYKDWYELNNAMRVHQNFVEQLPHMLTILLVCGLYTPEATLGIGILNCITRPVYIWGYLAYGPDKRKYGGITGGLPLNFLLVYTIGYGIYGLAT